MEIKINKNSEKVIIKPGGKLDITVSQKFREEVFELIDEGNINLVLDLGEVPAIDSSGLGKIILINRRIKQEEGSFKIINLQSEYVRKMFGMIQLDKIIDIEWEGEGSSND